MKLADVDVDAVCIGGFGRAVLRRYQEILFREALHVSCMYRNPQLLEMLWHQMKIGIKLPRVWSRLLYGFLSRYLEQ